VSTVATGPKISSHQTFASFGGDSSRVGARQRPPSTSSPPVSSFAPAGERLVDPLLDPVAVAGVISGPTSCSRRAVAEPRAPGVGTASLELIGDVGGT